jgi:hypothetical protein
MSQVLGLVQRSAEESAKRQHTERSVESANENVRNDHQQEMAQDGRQEEKADE